MLKYASWFFTPLLGALLVYACLQVPSGEKSPLTQHLSIRYLQKAGTETGIASPVEAVAADYRGFDLFAVGTLFSITFLSVLLFFLEIPRWRVFFPFVLWLAGTWLLLGLGWVTLRGGSNFLDYEALALWGDPARARLNGALLLTGGVLLSLVSLILLALQWIRFPEVSDEH